MSPTFRLRSLPFLLRLSFTALLLVLAGGYLASVTHMYEHHEPRDGRAGFTMTDIEGAYHGVTTPPLLRELLETNHPAEVKTEEGTAQPIGEKDRALLLEWLTGEEIAANWSNVDFGDGYGSPEEITADVCGSCHGMRVPMEERAEPDLASWDDYSRLAFPDEIAPTDEPTLLASTHTHALALGSLTLLLCALLVLTRLPDGLKGLIAFLAAGGLLVDLGAWWLARESAVWTTAIVAGGAAHVGGVGLALLAILVELWLPAAE